MQQQQREKERKRRVIDERENAADEVCGPLSMVDGRMMDVRSFKNESSQKTQTRGLDSVFRER